MSAIDAFAPATDSTDYRPQRSAALALFEREVRRFLNIWQYSLLGPTVAGVLFVLVFGTAMRGQISDVQAAPYGQFILPGLVVQAVVTVGFVNGTTTLFEARRDRYINDVFASPLRWWEICGALVAGSVVRELLVGTGVILLSLPLVGLPPLARPEIAVLGGLGTLIVCAQLGVIAGALARSLDHVYFLESVVLVTLGFLSGVFYSVASLPTAWSLASHLDPVFWLVQAARAGVLGHADVSAWTAVGVVWVLAALLSAWTALLFATGRLKS